MLADPAAEQARRRVVRLCHAGLAAPALLAAVAGEVRALVGYDGAFWATTDPATVLVTGAHVEDLPRETAPLVYENEYLHDDVNKFSRLARGLRPVGTMSEATGGDLTRSRLHREVGTWSGFPGDNLKAAFVAGGACWGVCGLARADPGRHFTQADLSFMASICGHLGEGLRAAVLLAAVERPPGAAAEAAPAVIVLAGERVRSASAGAAALLDELAGGFAGDPGRLPSVLVAVAGAAGRAADADAGAPAHAVVRTRAGRWLELHGMRLEDADGSAQVAVVVGPARPPRLAAMVMSAYGLTAREREVAQLIVSGASTAEASTALHISPYTLQDHLKSIFDKVGVRSRGELTATVFERHYRPARPFPTSTR
jgi:DNA-binding CsgD family transcriptional regulator